jgi:hypothetical protein
MPRWASMSKRVAHCHPERKHFCKGLCKACYSRLPRIYDKAKTARNTPERRAKQKNYEQSRYKAVVHRRSKHAFDPADEARFQAAMLCGWCRQPLDGELPSIDHDHRCCSRESHCKHCWKCTRGFVHRQCNSLAIGYYEWLERKFGITDIKLAEYRFRFPVPRTRCDHGETHGAITSPLPSLTGQPSLSQQICLHTLSSLLTLHSVSLENASMPLQAECRGSRLQTLTRRTAKRIRIRGE